MNCLLEFLLIQKLEYEKHELSAKRRHIYVFNYKNKSLNDLTKQINNISNIKHTRKLQQQLFPREIQTNVLKITNYI